MDDALGVSVAERIADLDGDLGGALRREGNLIHKGSARGELHDDVVLLLVLSTVVDGDDIGMVEHRQRACLALEAPLEILSLGEGLGQELDRHGAPEPEVLRAVHRAHPAATEFLLQHQSSADDRGRDLVLQQAARAQRQPAAR